MLLEKEYKTKNKNNEIDYGKLGVSLIGACALAPYVFPVIGTIQTATLIPIVSKGLVAFGTTALSGITAYTAFDLFFDKTTRKDHHENISEAKKTEDISSKNKVSSKSVNSVKKYSDDNKKDTNINKEKKGDFVIC